MAPVGQAHCGARPDARGDGGLSGAAPNEETLLFSFPVTGGNVPVARWAHAAAAVGSLLFAYGGVGQVVLDDLAVLDVDLMTWRALKPRAASPRDRPGKLHAAAMAAAGGTLWLFGGQQGRKFLRELYALDTDAMSWALAAPAGPAPPARAGHTLTAVDGAGVFLFGGQGKKLFDDLHVLAVPQPAVAGRARGAEGSLSACSAGSGASGSSGAASGAGLGGAPAAAPACEWVEVKARGKGPSPRRGHSTTWDGGDSLVCFGGSTSGSTDNGVWVYSISRREWATPAVRGAVPSPRTHHSAVLLRPGQLLVFGGCNAQGVFFQDAYLLDLSTWTWSRPAALGALPAARYHHSCTRVGRRTVIYGGINPRQAFDGVVLVESSPALGGGELAAAADELCRMSMSSAASDGGASSAIGPSAGVSVYGGSSLHGSSAYAAYSAAHPPSAPPSLAGGGAAGGAGAPSPAASPPQAGPSLAGAAAAAAGASAASPPAPPSVASSCGGAFSLLGGDAMRLQLRDLLVKRHLEDLQISSARRAEELISSLERERNEKAAAERELLQTHLVLAEAEERARAGRRRAEEAAARGARDAAEAEAARGAAAEAAAAAAALGRQLAEANALLDSVGRELGLLSSRHHRLKLEHAALQRARDRDRDRAAAQAAAGEQQRPRPRSSGPADEPQTGSDEDDGGAAGPASGGSGPAPAAAAADSAAAELCLHAQPAAGCLLCAVQRYLSATQQLLANGTAGAAGAGAPAAVPGVPLPAQAAVDAGAGAVAAGGAGDDAASLQRQLAAARAALAESQAARAAAERAARASSAAADAAAGDAAELRSALARLGGDRLALAACGASELRDLEARLDAASRVVRDLVVERTVAELQRSSAAESALCTVCMERRKELVFDCGHTLCVECGEALPMCPFCRKDVTARIRLFQ
ncbi:hypothetical protein Rsub_04611 [Raphidocelis subcapitata]|uniref:RING-type domain-containing protein n=1 Tax=Raphidocelis subcapitata TaxID=307507 RepID=A0A2V0P5Q7_9CHLO|nr:hypothetical protein Rsub_04611 [Raphidocelis subcapitata]|eukprot:GBF92507.1 hypothetical protein Rsub_04611 [Raphidocelis subcapitata]